MESSESQAKCGAGTIDCVFEFVCEELAHSLAIVDFPAPAGADIKTSRTPWLTAALRRSTNRDRKMKPECMGGIINLVFNNGSGMASLYSIKLHEFECIIEYVIVNS